MKCRITAWKGPDARRQVHHATGPGEEELERAHGMRRIYTRGGPAVAVLSACPEITARCPARRPELARTRPEPGDPPPQT
jgi:hypothetical protein